MSVLVVVYLSLAGGVGAACRLLVDGLIRARVRIAYPLGTTVINVIGSFVLGVLTGLAVNGFLAEEWRLILGGGLMGGYTTFSTASFETVRLVQNRRYVAALANGLGMLVLSIAAAAFGLWIGGLR